MKKFKKTIALICSMALLFSVFSASVLADGQNGEGGNNAIEGNTSEVFELNQAYIDAHGGHMPVVAGSYELVENITVSEETRVETENAHITIDLKGHTITHTSIKSMYILGKVRGTAGDLSGSTSTTSPVDPANCVTGVILTINDSVGGGTITGAAPNGKGSLDYWINSTGVGTNKERGGCVLIQRGNKMILNGGTITNFEAGDEGGAICASNASEFVMNGGTIKNCHAAYGGAISGQGSSAATGQDGNPTKAIITINGGTISDNSASIGGGIRICRCNLSISDAVVTGNSATKRGGGIDALYKNESTVSIHGSLKVYGNTCTDENIGEASSNFYVNSQGDRSEGVFYTLALDGDLSADANICFGVSDVARFPKLLEVNGHKYDMSTLHCDMEGYNVYEKDGFVQIINTDIQYSVGIGGEITLLVRVKLSGSNAANAYVEASYEYTKNGSTKSKSVNVDIDDAKSNSGDYYTFAIPVESACMTAPIEISVHAGDNVITDSGITIEKYAKVVKDQYSQYADLCDALLIFGGYAQVQLNINTDNLPTVSGVDFENGTAANYGLPSSGFNTLPTGVAGNLSLLSQTEIKLRFKKADLGDTAPTMTIEGYSDTIEGEASGNYYIYTIKGPDGKGFNYSAYETTFNFTVGSISGTYSVYDYLRSVKSKSSSSAAWKNLVEAYYNFAEAVKAI